MAKLSQTFLKSYVFIYTCVFVYKHVYPTPRPYEWRSEDNLELFVS